MDQSLKNQFKRELDALSTIRDELKLKAHLARQDLKDEIDRLESKFRAADQDLNRTVANTRDEVDRLGNDVKQLLVDLKQGYESVKRRLSS